jgi:opacity protein-like surface antigen
MILDAIRKRWPWLKHLVCGLLGLPISAQAAEVYAEVLGGLTFLDRSDWDFNDDEEEVSLETDTGFNVGGAVGVGFPLGSFRWRDKSEILYGIRLETQLTYTVNDADQINENEFSSATDGDVTMLAGMGNMYLELGTGAPLTVWVGAGAGYAQAKVDLFFAEDEEPLVDEDGALAYQLMAGTTINFTPYLGLSARYTRFVAEDFDFTTDPDFGDFDFEAGHASHAVSAGLVFRWNLGSGET